MITDISTKYVLTNGKKVSLNVMFDTEQEAKEYIEKTFLRPYEWKVILCKEVWWL